MQTTPLFSLIIAACALTACAPGGGPGATIVRGNEGPVTAAYTGTESYRRRSSQIQGFVNTHHGTLIAELTAGGGATLTQAMSLARIPPADRSKRIAEMRRDIVVYRADPAALASALLIYGR